MGILTINHLLTTAYAEGPPGSDAWCADVSCAYVSRTCEPWPIFSDWHGQTMPTVQEWRRQSIEGDRWVRLRIVLHDCHTPTTLSWNVQTWCSVAETCCRVAAVLFSSSPFEWGVAKSCNLTRAKASSWTSDALVSHANCRVLAHNVFTTGTCVVLATAAVRGNQKK